ncbi:MAG: hypothetical protein M0R03_21425 [Novosphingobium sp.]|jgi:hypothetical protein|nr:hypothetical protein [Novosphingobium sp.]
MKIETKFNLDDIVYSLTKSKNRIKKTCVLCKGSGEVTIENTNRIISCPDCYGHGYHVEDAGEMWIIHSKSGGKIGKVEVELYSEEYERENKVKYMIDSTGVGSGTVWYEENIFKTKKEAQKECDKRNLELENE